MIFGTIHEWVSENPYLRSAAQRIRTWARGALLSAQKRRSTIMDIIATELAAPANIIMSPFKECCYINERNGGELFPTYTSKWWMWVTNPETFERGVWILPVAADRHGYFISIKHCSTFYTCLISMKLEVESSDCNHECNLPREDYADEACTSYIAYRF